MSALRVGAACAVTAVATAAVGTAAVASPQPGHAPAGRHVLLLSVDGLHQQDLAWYVAGHPPLGPGATWP